MNIVKNTKPNLPLATKLGETGIPAHKAEFNARSKAWQKANRKRVVAFSRRWKFGLSFEEQEQILTKPCFCGSKATHIDHDHQTGIIRGGLCGNCNTGLGMFKDNPDTLRKAVQYLEQSFENHMIIKDKRRDRT